MSSSLLPCGIMVPPCWEKDRANFEAKKKSRTMERSLVISECRNGTLANQDSKLLACDQTGSTEGGRQATCERDVDSMSVRVQIQCQ